MSSQLNVSVALFAMGIFLLVIAYLIEMFGINISIKGIVAKCHATYFMCFANNKVCKLSYYSDITNETCIEFDTPCYMINTDNHCKLYDYNDEMNNTIIQNTAISLAVISILLMFGSACVFSTTELRYTKVSKIDSNI